MTVSNTTLFRNAALGIVGCTLIGLGVGGICFGKDLLATGAGIGAAIGAGGSLVGIFVQKLWEYDERVKKAHDVGVEYLSNMGSDMGDVKSKSFEGSGTLPAKL